MVDTSENPVIFDLDFTQTLVESANSFYEKAKKARRKVPGAEAAIKRTKKLLEDVETKKVEIQKEVETKPLVKKRSRKWYEKFHWFICEDKVVIGGKDAKSNERILKTYLDDADLFFHADVHGAPYVVVKNGQENLSAECLDEIAAFAGEVGLDYHKKVRKRNSKEMQHQVFSDVLDIASKYGKPASVHSRYAWRDCLKILQQSSIRNVVFHWYSGPLSVLKDILEAGYCLSATPAVEYGTEHAQAIRETPLDRLMLETDTPVVYHRGAELQRASEPADANNTFSAFP